MAFKLNSELVDAKRNDDAIHKKKETYRMPEALH